MGNSEDYRESGGDELPHVRWTWETAPRTPEESQRVLNSLAHRCPSSEHRENDEALAASRFGKQCALTLPLDNPTGLKEVVQVDLQQRGYHVSDGLKFGGDFLAYPGDPSSCHSDFIVKVAASTDGIPLLDLVAMSRVAVSSRKKVLVASEVTPVSGFAGTSLQVPACVVCAAEPSTVADSQEIASSRSDAVSIGGVMCRHGTGLVAYKAIVTDLNIVPSSVRSQNQGKK